jgi:hypothetical protein
VRFVLAIVSFVIGVLLVGLGIGQKTVFAPSPSIVASAPTTRSAPVTVIPGGTLVANAGYQRIKASGSSTAFAAYGRTSDVDAWLGSARHKTLRYDAATGKLRAKVTGTTKTVPNPAGSDLWWQEYTGKDLNFVTRLPSDMSILIVSNGTKAAPSNVSITWPRSTATPLLGPLLTIGGFFVLLGIAFFIWALVHQRRSRGPRRRSGGGGRPPRVRASRRAAAAGAQVPRRSRRGRRMIAVIPVAALASIALVGCSSQDWPQSAPASADATPTASASAEAAPATAATLAQIKRIVRRVATVASAADAKRDSTAIAERFTGAALEQRKANYAIRAKDSSESAPPTIAPSGVSVALPEQTSSWPRTTFVVDTNTKAQNAQALTLVQASPRDQYKVEYDVSLEGNASFSGVPSVSVGAAQLSQNVKLLKVQPGQLATAYADVLQNDTSSKYNDLFQSTGDDLRTKIGKAYKTSKAKSLPSTAKIAFSSEIPTNDSIALATNKAGALVSTDLEEIETVTPTASGAEVNTEGAVKALSGVSSSNKGITATYGVQLLFYVPPVGSSDKIELLGFTQGLIAASEVK